MGRENPDSNTMSSKSYIDIKLKFHKKRDKISNQIYDNIEQQISTAKRSN